MLLNKIPCLDKGYVAYVSSSNNSKKLKELALEFLKSHDTSPLQQIANLTIVIKCPLFVQLNLSKFNLSIVAANTNELDAYIPNAGEVGGPDRQTNEMIADDMNRTTEALLINPKAYQADGCDKFVSQIMTPINTYTTLIVHGQQGEWLKFCSQSNAPSPISSYMSAVKQILDMEWR